MLAVSLARELGLGDEDVRAVQQVSLLRFLGCTADAAETADLAGGDDVAFNAAFAPFLNGRQYEAVKTLARSVGSGKPPLTKGRMVLAALADTEEPARGLAAHCEVAAMLARRLGLDEQVTAALDAAYERWDGKGYPTGLEGEAIPVEIRIAMVARDVDLFKSGGWDAHDTLKRRRGRAYDPSVVDAYEGLNAPHPEADWDMVMASEPEPIEYVDDLDSALTVMADFVDLKSPWTRGHSRDVARLAEAAAREMGWESADAEKLGRAGLVHDLGRVGIPNGVWDKPGPLSTDEMERVRLHTYLTDRVLSRCPELRSLSKLASSHHERIDGSGYHRQLAGDQLSGEARLLAATDMLAALASARPHRQPYDLVAATDLVRREAKEGRLDQDAVEAVIAAAGGEPETPESHNPDGLTDREVEVLSQLCRGLTNRQVGEELFISPKTVGRHVENIYTKIGVSTRAAAAVYAMEHGLLH